MRFCDYLACEWIPALGCTEPASIAYAASKAQEQSEGEILRVSLVVDPKMYKNCYAVGIPHTRHRTGIAWAVALGSHLRENALGLEIFRTVDDTTLVEAGKLIDGGRIRVDVDKSQTKLWIDCTVEKARGKGRAVISGEHTHIARLEKDGEAVLVEDSKPLSHEMSMREKIAAMPLSEMLGMARRLGEDDRKSLRQGAGMNKKIAQHGLKLFPSRFIALTSHDELANISRLVCAGVYARMWGEEFTVMSLAGSGNKGIVASVPIYLHAERLALSEDQADEALALACLITSATTCQLGTLSAVCGCSNAAGIGLAAGLVLLEGGGEAEISLAMNNMVGNLSGMICDGAKIGCALKTMTSVDAAFRSSALALCGIGIPPSDGIVAASGMQSLQNLGRLASAGMVSTDIEILAIMQEKLDHALSSSEKDQKLPK